MVSVANRILIWFKSAYIRITLTKTSIAFFLFTFAYCFAHALIQSLLFELDSDSNSLTSRIISTAQVPTNEFAWLSQDHSPTTDSTVYTLKICNAIPFEKSEEEDPCHVVFQTDNPGAESVPSGLRRRQNDSSNSDATSSQDASGFGSGGNFTSNISEAAISAVFDPVSNNVSSIDLTFPGINAGEPMTLDAVCTRNMLYADQVLRNSKREEIALIGSEFWLLWTSVIALLYGSIAHLYSALAFRVLSVGWSAYSIWRTHDINHRFDVLLTEGPCGVDLFPQYFRQRTSIQIADLALNAVALLLLSYLIARLVRTYKTKMFRCIGPPDHVVKIHRFVLGLFTCLQVAIYFLITSAALWLDQLRNGAIASISSHMALYLAIFIFILVLLLPWIAIGWRSVRYEQRLALPVFVVLGLIFEAGWSGMYDSLVWRWTWIQWPFFASTAVAAQFILLASVVLGIICRMNFGKGLKEYLEAASVLEKDDFEPDFVSDNKSPSQNSADDDRWVADIEKAAKERLSQALDFGAHQPAPPVSPPAYDTKRRMDAPLAPAPAILNPISHVHTTSSDMQYGGRTERPQSFTGMLPSLPSLGKYEPWHNSPEDDEDGDNGHPGPRGRI